MSADHPIVYFNVVYQGNHCGRTMLTSSSEIKRRLERDGWIVVRVKGSHHVFKHPRSRQTIVLPHPKKDLGLGLVRAIYKQAQWKLD